MLQNRLFFVWHRDPVLELQFPTLLARSSIVLCNSVSADRIVMAASRLLRAVAAFVILLSCAAGSRKSYWSGCMKAATVICQQIFSILALVIFLLKILLKSASKSSFFRSGVEISGFGATISDAVARSSIVLCNSVSADRIVMAASRLLRAVAAFVILLSFAAGSRKSYWSGCMKAATVIFGTSDFPSKNPFKKCFKIVFFLLWRRDPSGFWSYNFRRRCA